MTTTIKEALEVMEYVGRGYMEYVGRGYMPLSELQARFSADTILALLVNNVRHPL